MNYGRHGSVSGNVILNYFEQHVICVTEIRFEINSIHRVGQRSNIGVALALLGAENVDTTPNFAEGCSFLKMEFSTKIYNTILISNYCNILLTFGLVSIPKPQIGSITLVQDFFETKAPVF